MEPVKTIDGSVVGKIQKQFGGFAKEVFTKADNFKISFPMDLDVRMKAVVIGACFLISKMTSKRINVEELKKKNAVDQFSYSELLPVSIDP
uniref:Phospholipid scramblase n=1 Tax=Strigamia maritima TaxID=126957 RepID=T1JGA0_STRMM